MRSPKKPAGRKTTVQRGGGKTDIAGGKMKPKKQMPAKKKSEGGMRHAGGSKNFDEKTGTYKKGTAPRRTPGSGRTPKPGTGAKRRVMKKK